MTATAHALVGGIVAASIPNPLLGLTISALSHPILDMVPHWDFGWGWKKKSKLKLFGESVFDLSLGFVLAYLLFGSQAPLWYLVACVFVSEVWDIMEAPFWFLNWKFPPFSWIYNVQSKMQGKVALPWGILTQVASVGIIYWFLQVMP